MVFMTYIPSCRHNKMVECPRETRDCSKCGWNPEIAHKRLMEFVKNHPELADEKLLEELAKEERDQE